MQCSVDVVFWKLCRHEFGDMTSLVKSNMINHALNLSEKVKNHSFMCLLSFTKFCSSHGASELSATSRLLSNRCALVKSMIFECV